MFLWKYICGYKYFLQIKGKKKIYLNLNLKGRKIWNIWKEWEIWKEGRFGRKDVLEGRKIWKEERFGRKEDLVGRKFQEEKHEANLLDLLSLLILTWA